MTCYECGKVFRTYAFLKDHLEQKLQYSMAALVECTVLIMFENRSSLDPPTSWRRGYVKSYNTRTKQHRIEFSETDAEGQGVKTLKLNLQNYAFYIKERSSNFLEIVNRDGEAIYKPKYEIGYVMAQSFLAKVYGVQEVGHRTLGHLSVRFKLFWVSSLKQRTNNFSQPTRHARSG